MKIEKEIVEIPLGKSFRCFRPSLRNYFYWHYHPEFELVFVEAISGIRHIGKHISSYVGSDLLLIGSNVPHLNFDYGLEVAYKQVVVQIKEDFSEKMLPLVPELNLIKKMFSRAYLGLAFHGQTKEIVVERLKHLEERNNFEAFLDMLDILRIMAISNEYEELNNEDTSIRQMRRDRIRMSTVYDYIHDNYNRNPDVNMIASEVGLSTSAFCRYFKKQTDLTFTDFINQYRLSQAKTMLLKDMSVSEVCYNVGLESLSYFNKLFRKFTGDTPTNFKKQYLNRVPN